MRILWEHTNTNDWTNSYGIGHRPVIETRYPDDMNIRISELPRAKQAARRAYARHYGVHLQDVTASPVYNTGMASVAYVVAYMAGETCGAQLDWKGATCARPADHRGAHDSYSG